MKPWFLSKTLAVNALVLALAYWFRWSDFYVDPLWFVWAVALANIGLRLVTRHSLG